MHDSETVDHRRRSLLAGIAGGVLLSGCGSGGESGPGGEAPSLTGYRASLYPGTWPADMANSNRSGTVIGAGLPADFDPGALRIDSYPVPFPVFTYTRAAGEVFVAGGLPAVLAEYVSAIDGLPTGATPPDPHITRIDPLSGRSLRLALDRGTGFPYIGGALMHGNGSVYVVSQAHLYKIIPETMQLAASIELPDIPGKPRQALVYNGLAVSRSGRLLTKAFSGGSARFVLVDPESLAIDFVFDHNGASPRLTVSAAGDGGEYLYHLDREQVFRFLIGANELTPDPDWGTAYRPYPEDSSNDEPTSPVVAGGRVYYTTNTAPGASHAMKLFWAGVDEVYPESAPPLVGEFMFSDAETAGWNFFHPTVDDVVTDIVIGMDQANGRIAALRVGADERLERLWEQGLRVSARPAIVADRGLVYCTDYADGRNYFVALDLATGSERARLATPATRATIATIAVGGDGEVYFASNEPGQAQGYLHRITLAG